jgi:hypothetical protein
LKEWRGPTNEINSGWYLVRYLVRYGTVHFTREREYTSKRKRDTLPNDSCPTIVIGKIDIMKWRGWVGYIATLRGGLCGEKMSAIIFDVLLGAERFLHVESLFHFSFRWTR